MLISWGVLLLTEYENIDGQLQRDEIKVVHSLRIQYNVASDCREWWGGGGGVLLSNSGLQWQQECQEIV